MKKHIYYQNWQRGVFGDPNLTLTEKLADLFYGLPLLLFGAFGLFGCADPIGHGSPFDEHLHDGYGIEEPYSKHNAQILHMKWDRQDTKLTENDRFALYRIGDL